MLKREFARLIAELLSVFPPEHRTTVEQCISVYLKELQQSGDLGMESASGTVRHATGEANKVCTLCSWI